MPKNRGKNSKKTKRKRRRQLRTQPDGREKEIERDYEMKEKEALDERRADESRQMVICAGRAHVAAGK